MMAAAEVIFVLGQFFVTKGCAINAMLYILTNKRADVLHYENAHICPKLVCVYRLVREIITSTCI